MSFNDLELQIARGFRGRMRGLLGHCNWPRNQALWLRPCRAVHTVGMRFALTIYLLDGQDRLVRLLPSVPPGRMVWMPGTRSVIEMLRLAPDDAFQVWSILQQRISVARLGWCHAKDARVGGIETGVKHTADHNVDRHLKRGGHVKRDAQ